MHQHTFENAPMRSSSSISPTKESLNVSHHRNGEKNHPPQLLHHRNGEKKKPHQNVIVVVLAILLALSYLISQHQRAVQVIEAASPSSPASPSFLHERLPDVTPMEPSQSFCTVAFAPSHPFMDQRDFDHRVPVFYGTTSDIFDLPKNSPAGNGTDLSPTLPLQHVQWHHRYRVRLLEAFRSAIVSMAEDNLASDADQDPYLSLLDAIDKADKDDKISFKFSLRHNRRGLLPPSPFLEQLRHTATTCSTSEDAPLFGVQIQGSDVVPKYQRFLVATGFLQYAGTDGRLTASHYRLNVSNVHGESLLNRTLYSNNQTVSINSPVPHNAYTPYILDCNQINEVEIVRKLGEGKQKFAMEVILPNGVHAAAKRCHSKSCMMNHKIIEEARLLQGLQEQYEDQAVQYYGYCFFGSFSGKTKMNSTDLSRHATVFIELGTAFNTGWGKDWEESHKSATSAIQRSDVALEDLRIIARQYTGYKGGRINLGEDNKYSHQYIMVKAGLRHMDFDMIEIVAPGTKEDVLQMNCYTLLRQLAGLKKTDPRFNCTEAYSRENGLVGGSTGIVPSQAKQNNTT